MTAPSPEPSKPLAPKPLWENVITLGGFFLAAIAMVLLVMFGLFATVTPVSNPYVDIVGYLVVPILLGIGVGLMPLGIFIKSWWVRRHHPEERLVFRLPRINLNDPHQRRVAKIILIFGVTLLPIVGISSYHGYHYTDSAEFCSQACHQVMEPQASTFANSAHARVSCAECHIGSGASWFVKSKLSGTRQVFATLGNSFPRPIPPAITELRPARETCEHCHWPNKFFGVQLHEIVRFASDEGNTKRKIDMLLKTGGGDETVGRAEGIHMHMAIANRIEYVATDDKLQVIPWVRMVDSAGNELIFRSDGLPSSDPRPEGIVRKFDCMDCHNRPAHKFRPPNDSVDTYMNIGRIDPRLPYIKREAVKVLSRPYPDTHTAEAQIGLTITAFYSEHYTDTYESHKSSIHQAIDSIREIYRQNFFPSMKVRWETYPDNIGHMASPGCFRCHSGDHVNQFGQPITASCNACHDFLNPGKLSGEKATIERGEFVHPFEKPPGHEKLQCYQCHGGGHTPEKTCQGCHTTQDNFRQGKIDAFEPFEIAADGMADMSCQDCHQLSKGLGWETIRATCGDCHEAHEVEGWKKEADSLLTENVTPVSEEDHAVLEHLRKAGPLHNLVATRKIIAALKAKTAANP